VNVNDIALHVNACASVKNSIANLKHFISPAYRFLKKGPISFLPYVSIIPQ